MSERKTKAAKKIVPQSNSDEGNNYDITAQVSLSPINPIPLELENIFGFSPGGNKFIPFFAGQDKEYGFNSFFVNILQSVLQSVTQSACINTKAQYTIGDGIYLINVDEAKDKTWQNFKSSANGENKSLNTVLLELIKSYLTFGNVCIEFVKGSVGGKKFLYVYVKNTLDCRKGWPDENNSSNAVIISRWFRKPGTYNLTQKFNIRIPFYNTGEGLKDKYWVEDSIAVTEPDKEPTIYMGGKPDGQGIGVYRTAIWMRQEYAGYDHYGLPSWLSSKIDGMNEYNSKHYNLDNLDNNMVPGGLLQLTGSMTSKEVNQESKRINNSFSGKGKIGRTIVTCSEGGVQDSKYTPFNTSKESSYDGLIESSKEAIFIANEWDGALIGAAAKGTMGKGGAYLKELYQQKIKTVIKPLHRKIKDEFFDPLCEIANEWLGTKWNPDEMDIQISNLFDDTTEANTTVAGLDSFLKIVEMVAGGKYPLDAAIELVQERFGKTKEESTKLLGNIVVNPLNNKPTPIPTDV